MESDVIIVIFTFALLLLVLGIFLVLFYLLFKKKQKTHQLKIAALHEQLLETQIEIQEQTLKNVSQEIHDNIGQVLALAKLNLNTFPPMAEPETQQKLFSTKELVSKALSDLRDLAKSMHGEKIAQIGLQNAVTNELTILQNTGQFKTHLTVKGDPYPLAPQTQTIIFRIIQEALHNQIKHSKAQNIYVDFNYGNTEFLLTLKDDGVGFDVDALEAASAGIGLKSMKNRAALVGAVFSISSVKNMGTTIMIRISKDIHNIAVR